MTSIRLAQERGRSQLDWLESWHSFSFDRYYDPAHMDFGYLRVINEDYIAGGGGFGMHPHRDMEIITYVIEGQLRHKDNMGNTALISPGEIQKMSAGTGVWHSEYNESTSNPVHLLQIWIHPAQKNLQPAYEQQKFELQPGKWKLLGSPDGDGLISINQKLRLYALSAPPNSANKFETKEGSKVWVQLVKGACNLGASILNAGDGLALDTESDLTILANTEFELLLFEMW